MLPITLVALAVRFLIVDLRFATVSTGEPTAIPEHLAAVRPRREYLARESR